MDVNNDGNQAVKPVDGSVAEPAQTLSVAKGKGDRRMTEDGRPDKKIGQEIKLPLSSVVGPRSRAQRVFLGAALVQKGWKGWKLWT